MDSASYFDKIDSVTELTPKDFDGMATWKLKNRECSAVLFYAPWCGYCKAVKDTWIQFSKTAAFMNAMAFNCEKYSAHLLKIKEDMPGLVQSYPTIIFYINGSPVEAFKEERTHAKLLKTAMHFCEANHRNEVRKASDH